MLNQMFEQFLASLEVNDLEEVMKRFGEITKRLNLSFYAQEGDTETHGHVVGSLARKTAISGFSDLDMLFVLPKELKKQYDNHDGNGQSKLLQRVKKEIKKRYPKTIVRGDGQVVVVSFESINKIIEVCPAFERSDGAFDYPDSNNGGTWKKTDPFPEIEKSNETIEDTNSNFKYVCHILRAWKNNEGFKFGGLLIDTLVYNFFQTYPAYKESTFDNYLALLNDLFCYLKNRNAKQSYWYALGSNQKVYNKKGTFVAKASVVYENIKNLTVECEDLYDILQEIFGKDFPVPENIQETAAVKKSLFAQKARQTEEFIENKFLVDIRYSLKIDCKVKQDGFREKLLRTMIRDKTPLKPQKSLEFFIVENEFDDLTTDSDDPHEYLQYEVYWKVLNRGVEAINRDQIRGQIVSDAGKQKKTETTNFSGEHYVECYIVYQGICVAKNKIKVPIQTF